MAAGTGSFFKGISQEQDIRFKNKERKLMQSIKWPKEFDESVDLSKVELGTIKSWIKTRMIGLLGFEDEVVTNLAITQLEAADINNPLCPKRMQINLTGFLEDKAMTFMKELWNLLLVSQKSEGGIAPDFIQAKKAELLKRKEELEKKRALVLRMQEAIKQGKPEEDKKERIQENHTDNSRKKESPRNHEERRHENKHKHHSHRRHHRHRSRHSSEERSRSRHRERSRDRRERSRSKEKRPSANAEKVEAELRKLAVKSVSKKDGKK
eukprot:TRINITY_DN10278_c0_g1_i1.p1 TRINITY_DN10278_c0_g1~~TRINITY_DN10278_c0_g1_i1.p1  ORF type:complete len:267 (-),score=86.94 TRINITY_DN10278_c0_g1_i1:148-948(-)